MRFKYILKKLRKEKRKFLIETEAREVLKKYNINFPKWFLAKNVEQAIIFSKKIGYPVVLKIVSKHIIHKSDVGGVFINLRDEEEVKNAFMKIIKNVKKKKPRAKIEGILISKMIENGVEVIIGGIKDLQFGHIIMFGAGGVYTEIVKDTSFRIVPISKKDAEEMIKETKIFKVLKGHRGKKYDIEAVIKMLLKVSKFLEENKEVKELDINPVIVLTKGAVAVDARIVVE